MPSSIQKSLGARIRGLRLEYGLSQEAFADLCDMDRTYVSGIERGARNPTISSLETIAKALKVRLADLFKDL